MAEYWTKDKREALVATAKEHGNISQLAEEHDINRSTLHRWIQKVDRGDSLEDKSRAHKNHPYKKEDHVIEKILEISLPQPFWGCHKIARILNERGIAISSRTVQKVLKRHHLGSIDLRCERIMKARYKGKIQIPFKLEEKILLRNDLFSCANFKGLYPGEVLFGMTLQTNPFTPHIPGIQSPEGRRVKICLLYDFYSTFLSASIWEGRMSLLESVQDTFNGRVGSIYLVDGYEEDFADISWPGVVGTIAYREFPVPSLLSDYFHPVFIDLDDRYQESVEHAGIYDKVNELRKAKDNRILQYKEELQGETDYGDVYSDYQIYCSKAEDAFSKEVESLLETDLVPVNLSMVEEVLSAAVDTWNRSIRTKGYPVFGKSPAEIVGGYVYSDNDHPWEEPLKDDRIKKIIQFAPQTRLQEGA